MMSGSRKAVQKASIWPVVPNSMANTCWRANPSSRLATVPAMTMAAAQANDLPSPTAVGEGEGENSNVSAFEEAPSQRRSGYPHLASPIVMGEGPEAIDRLFGDEHAAELDGADLRAVVVAASSRHQVEPARQVQEAPGHVRQMVRVVDLDTLQAGVRQLAQGVLGGPVALRPVRPLGMRPRGDAARVPDDFDGLLGTQLLTGDVGRPVDAQPALEGLVEALHVAALEHGPSDVRPANGAIGDALHPLKVQRHA